MNFPRLLLDKLIFMDNSFLRITTLAFTLCFAVSASSAEEIEMICTTKTEGQVTSEVFKYSSSLAGKKQVHLKKNGKWRDGSCKQRLKNHYKRCESTVYDRGAVIKYFVKTKQIVEEGQAKLSDGYTHNMEVKFILDFDFLTFKVINHVKNKDGSLSFMKRPNVTDFKCKTKEYIK